MSTRRATARRGARMSATRSTAERRPLTRYADEHAEEQRAGDLTGRRHSTMQGTVLYGAGDLRFEERDAPTIIKPTDAIIRIAATCVCGSDLWPYRGLQAIAEPTPMGHEYCGVVEEVGSAVRTLKPGHFVIGSFFASDNTCPHCRAGYQSSCQQREFVGGAQAAMLRVPLADGTLVGTPEGPSEHLIPSLLALSDLLRISLLRAVAANVQARPTDAT